MSEVKSPFIATGKIEPANFCDRVVESQRIVQAIANGKDKSFSISRKMRTFAGNS